MNIYNTKHARGWKDVGNVMTEALKHICFSTMLKMWSKIDYGMYPSGCKGYNHTNSKQ